MSDIWTPENASAGDPRDAEVRSIAWNNFLLSDESYSGRWRTSAEVRITPETALQSTCVLAACRILAETIAGLPIHIYRRLENGERKVAEDIPLHKVLTFAPNAWQTKYEFFEQMVMNITLWGNNYSLVRSGKYGSVSELLNLHPSRMDVERLENGRLRYNYTDPETGKYERYSQDEVMHVRWTPEPDGIKGIVPVEIAREAIALARACEIHAAKYWANSARPGIVLTTDGTLSAEAAEKLRENWERLHRGVDRAYKTAILTGGLKPEQIGFTAEQSQFIDSRRFQCEEIARVYRLPLHLIQGTPGGNLEIQGQEFVTYTLMPWLKRIESAISRSLIWNDDLFFAEFDVRGLLRADSNSRASYYSTMMSLGILSVNEIRRLENLQPLGEEGDKHFIAMNVQPLEDAGKPKQDPMAAMMGAAAGGAPPPKEKGVPSLPGAKTGEAPLEMPKGEGSEKKQPEEKEKRDCGRDDSGKFGPKNRCAADDGGSNISGGSAPKGKALKGKALLASLPKTIEAGSDLLKKYVPFTPVSRNSNKQFSRPPSDEKAKAALNKSQQEKYGAHREKPEGYPMSLRIDINAFENKQTYVVTAHEKVDGLTVGSVIGYDNVVRLSGPVTFKSKEDNATLVATGDASKSPIATVTGRFSKSKDIPFDIDSWTPVGYDPKKAAYFYDKVTGQEVTGGTDSISIGNSVFVRKPTHGERKAQVQYRAANFWGTETRELPDQTAAYYDTMTSRVEQAGKFSHDAVAYTNEAKAGKTCAGCLFFDAGVCEIVSDPISPSGSCRLHETDGGSESRDCGRDDGGKFGSDNKCQIKNSTGEPIRGVRKGRNRRQTRVARKIYQMGSSEKQIKGLIRDLGGKVRNTLIEIDSTRGDEGINIFVRDADLNENHVIHVGYYGATVYPTDPIGEEEASRIEESMREAMPKTISDRLYGGGKEYPIEVLREPSDFIRPPASAKKSFQDKYNQRDCGTGAGAGGFKPGNDCASGRGDKVETRVCDSSDKNDAGRFTEGNDCAAGDGKSKSSSPSSKANDRRVDVQALVRKIAENPDGFTIHPYTQGSPKDGIMVSEFSNSDAKRSLQISDAKLEEASTADSLTNWLDENEDAFEGREDRFIGGWKDGDKFFLDISTRFPPEKAKQALDAGRTSGQLAVFNLGNFKTTWVKFDADDPNKPDDWDKGFARARKEAAVSQAYDEDTPPMDEEDWAAELSKHGQTTVRSLLQHLANSGYNFEARAIEGLLRRAGDNERQRHEQAGANRRSDGGHSTGSVSGIPGDGRGKSQGEWPGTRSSVVQGRPGGSAWTLSGIEEEKEVESRQDCGRDSNGRFTIDNDCAVLDKDFTDSPSSGRVTKIVEYTANQLKSGLFSGAEKLESLTVRSPRGEKPQTKLRELGVSSFSDLLRLGAALTRGGHVEAVFADDEVQLSSSFPIEKDSEKSEDSWEGYAHVTTEITREPDGKIGVHWDEFIFEDGDSINETDRHRVSSLLSEAALDAAAAAEKAGVSKISTLAAGTKGDDTYQGYRLWPQFGFDGVILPSVAEKIPKSIRDSLPTRTNPTVQQLISTPEGKRWWNENGSTTYMKLDFSDKNSLGYKKFKKKLSLLDRLRGRNQDRSYFPELVEYRDDCGNDGNTGRFTKGNTCAADDGGSNIATGSATRPRKQQAKKERKPKQEGPKGTPAKLNWRPGSPLPNYVQEAIDEQPTKRSADGSQIVSTPIADEKDIYNFAAKDFVSTVKVGEHLAAKQAASRGERIDTGKDGGLHPEEEAYMVDSLAQQAKQAMARGIEPKFYSPEERAAQLDEFSVLIPQVKGGRTKTGALIEQEDAEHLFRAVQAMTSPNASPFSNMQRTDQLLNKFFNNDADLRTSETLGVTGPGIRKSLGRYMAVVERLGKRTNGGVDIAEGLKKTRELFTGKVLSPNDAKSLFDELIPGSGEEYKPSNYQVDTKVPLFSTFGPKVGPFFANNNGETDHLTADIWWTRTWGRNSGELVVPPSPTKGAEKARELLKVAGRAKREHLHGVDGQSLVSSLKEMTKSGVPDDIVRQWAGERLRHYARGDYKEKTGLGGTLNRLAKNIVENDWHLMRDPGGGRRRAAMIKAAQKASSKVGLPPAYLQDVLWQDEQDAYAALGAKTVTSQGELSLYSDVIRRIATEDDARKPMAERVGVKPKRPKKSKRSAGGDPLVEVPYDDYDKGGREQMLFDAATHELSDEQFVDILLRYAEKATDYEPSPESRSLDCGRADGGRFGPRNTCAADDGGSNISAGSGGSASWGSDSGTEVYTDKKPLFKGAENIGEIRINRSRDVRGIAGDALKMPIQEILDATGVPAQKAASGVIGKPKVTITPEGSQIGVYWSAIGKSTGEGFAPHEMPFAKHIGESVIAANAVRTLTPSAAGPKLELSSMVIHPDFQRKGIASEAVLRATSSPLAELKMVAARADSVDPHLRLVGYAVWPKFGYNAPIKSAWHAIDKGAQTKALEAGGDLALAAAIVDEAEDNFNALVEANGGRKPADMIDLFSMKGGQEWWREYGSDINLYFDRRPRSPSREALSMYMDSRKKRRRSESQFTPGERASDWDITDEDEAILEEVWREMIERGPQEKTPEDLEFLRKIEESEESGGDAKEVRED